MAWAHIDSQMTWKAVTLVHSTERIKSRCCRAQNVGSKVATNPQWLPSCPLDSPFSRSTAKPVPLKVLSWAKNQTHLKLLMAPLRIYKSRVEADINARLLCHILFYFFFTTESSWIQMRPCTVWWACFIHAEALSFFSTHSGRAQWIHEGLGPPLLAVEYCNVKCRRGTGHHCGRVASSAFLLPWA